MSRLRMTKAVLAQRRKELATFGRALPSLELKRQQLMLDLAAERAAAGRLHDEAERLRERACAIRFAADEDVALEPLLRLVGVEYGSETRLGIALPVIERIDWSVGCDAADFPPWVEAALTVTRALAEALLRGQVAEARAELVDRALRKTIQRINLLQQVLMPRAVRDIAQIGNFLADAQRMAIARTKLLVSRRAGEVRAS